MVVPDVVTLAALLPLREESMAGDWLQVLAPLGLTAVVNKASFNVVERK